MDGAANFAAWGALGILLAAQSALAAAAGADGRVAQLSFGPPATAPTSQAAAIQPVARSTTKPAYESIQLGQRGQQQRATPTPLLSNDSNVLRVVGALGVVLGCIFVVRWAGKKFLGLQAAGATSGPVQVLLRTTVSPRQQLMLIQVGRRIVLVANCGVQMNALCEISDVEEVAALAGELQQKRKTSATSAFLSIFGKAGAIFEDEQQEAAAPAEAENEEEPSREPLVPELATTRQEMRGLLDRVHKLSQHYHRTSP
jgi:flagellar biogenesis protein FliO